MSGKQRECVRQPIAVRAVVQPPALSRWMRERDHEWPVPERVADAILERAWTEEAGDCHLAYEDENPWLQHPHLGVEPVRTVGDRRGWRPQVSSAAAAAPRKAAHEGRDVGQAAKLFGAFETGPHHPSVQLLPGSARERASRLTLRAARRLADHEERRPPLTGEGWVCLFDDAGLGAYAACPARGLVTKQRDTRRTHRADPTPDSYDARFAEAGNIPW